MAIGAVRYCLQIRNQYAHCNWYDDYSGQLAFVNLEELAKLHVPVADLRSLTVHHVDVSLLQAQEAYFVFADRFVGWLNYEVRRRAGILANNPVPKPKQLTRPPLHLP
jgi:hypothetical protein